MSTGRLSSVAIYFTLESEANEDPPEFTLTCHSRGGPVTEVEWRRNRVRVEEDSNHMTSQIIVDPSSNTVYNNTLRVRGREGGLYVCDMSNNRHEHVEGASATGLSATQRANNEMSFAQFHISPSEIYKSQCYLQDTHQYITGVDIQHINQLELQLCVSLEMESVTVWHSLLTVGKTIHMNLLVFQLEGSTVSL